MKSAIKRELLEGLRTYKFLIIAAVFMFFALLNPVMNKLVLPEILKSQFAEISGDMLNQMLITSQTDNVIGYLSDVFEVGSIVVVLILASLVSGELRTRSFILPISSGKSFHNLVISKLTVYGIFTILVAVAATLFDYLYAGILFGFDISGVLPVIRAGLLQGLFFVFAISMVITVGSFVKKPIVAGMLTLMLTYGTQILSGLFKIEKFTPAGLLKEAGMLAEKANPGIYVTLAITVALVAAFISIAIIRLNSTELANSK